MLVVVIVITTIVLLKYTTENIAFPLWILPIFLCLQGKIDSKCNFSVTSAFGFNSCSEIFVNQSGVCTFFHSSLVKTRVLCALSVFASYTWRHNRRGHYFTRTQPPRKKMTVFVFVFNVLNFCPCFLTINNSCNVVNAKHFYVCTLSREPVSNCGEDVALK
jgi:hypothetical protein